MNITARVILSIRDEYRLLTPEGELYGEPSGALLYGAASAAELPVVGDWVEARVVEAGHAIVQAVLPRRTKFSRRAAGTRGDEQMIAANIDTVFLVSGLDHDFNLRRIERYLTLAHESGARPVMVLNKADLCADIDAVTAQVEAIAPGIPIACISARAGSVEPIRVFLQEGDTIALLGSSGAGKSTLLNRLLGADVLRTQEVRESDSRGRHTTTHRELIMLPGGVALIDNPGMRELQMWATEESLDETFRDIAEIAGGCRFLDCSHASEPGCAVQSALADGTLSADRWGSYTKLLAEIRYQQVKADPAAAAAQKQQWKTLHKAARIYKKRW